MSNRNIIVTSSLPYANGDLHLGHIIETIQTDIWARFQRMNGHHCYYVCGSDAHGTPIMIRAEKEGISPEELVKRTRENHMKDFADFLISFDSFYTTHSPENQYLTETIFKRLKENGDIVTRTIKQAYDPIKNMFLPDRFVKGECPKCHTPDQYGDSCEACGATYNPLEMKNPISTLSGKTPIEKESEHLFFDLPKYAEFLRNWLQTDDHVQKSIANKLDEWFKEGLQQWNISRDAPYFGFRIPGYDDKFFYVWMDAPIGYLASFQKLCEEKPEVDFGYFSNPHSNAEVYHFVGKDVVYFHTIFWPTLLKAANYRLPDAVFAHGFLTINGQKMSKSRGTFISARQYLDHLPAEYLRYYFASKLTSHIEDIDLNLEDFRNKVNSDLVGKLVNIASRCSGFITKYFDGMLAKNLLDQAAYQQFVDVGVQIAEHFENRQYSAAIREIMRLADLANQFVSELQPWILAKDEGQREKLHAICTQAINYFRILAIYLAPVMPKFAENAGKYLNSSLLLWHDSKTSLLNHAIQPYQALLTRIEETAIQALIHSSASNTQQNAPKQADETKSGLTPLKELISIDDFNKIDLRVAKVIAAEAVPEADKLIKLQLDLGFETRQVFAGIKSNFEPNDLLGKMVICVANLAPRKMRFGISEGMVIVASHGDGKELFLVSPDEDAQPGMLVK